MSTKHGAYSQSRHQEIAVVLNVKTVYIQILPSFNCYFVAWSVKGMQ